ncbi:MAG TPA: sulfatase-like hydrolase/transferase [Opitutaceae bacterium]|nr:sulfatase-like hydrolase/transferase [Opitutaceae bacterium]
MPKRQAILFLIDTQGANCVGCYRPDLALGTPNLDRLAAGGVRFDRAYTCTPVCGPARSALLTGLYPHTNGVLANDMAPAIGMPTLGERLQALGFATGYIGKWHLDGSDYFGDGRCPPGWDPVYWFDGRNYLDSLPDAKARTLSRQALGPAEIAANGITSEFTHAHRTVDRAIDFIREHRDRDFFLLVSIDEPHHPWICPEPFVSAFEHFEFPVPNADDPLTDKPRSQREWAAHTKFWEQSLRRRNGRATLHHPRHFGCNSYSDSQVGRVLAALEKETPSALTIYTADHGDMFGSHRLYGKGPAVYEEITRVPLIVRWGGHTPVGGVSASPVSHIDLAPTLLEYFGVPVPDLLQGRSLLAQFRRPAHATNEEVFLEFNRFEIDHDGFGAFAPIRCVFDGRYKLALNLLDQDEFYDLQDDALELRNRIDDPALAAVRERLHGRIIAWMNRTRDPLRGPHWRRRPWAGPDTFSTWGGPTRPRPADEPWYPRSMLYETGAVIERYEYDKK